MSVRTAQQYVIRCHDGEFRCPRCTRPEDYENFRNDIHYKPYPTAEERHRHVLYVCPQMDAVDRDICLELYPKEEHEPAV
jgi:hypothetical protein